MGDVLLLIRFSSPAAPGDVFPLVHRFANNVYAREITIPAGSLVVGKIHTHGHLNVITKGRVAVVIIEDGVEEFAPHTFISKAGTKRLVFAFEETIWTTFHGTERLTPPRWKRKSLVKHLQISMLCKPNVGNFWRIDHDLGCKWFDGG